MRLLLVILLVLLVGVVTGMMFCTIRHRRLGPVVHPPEVSSDTGALKIALIPERNIFEQRHRYQALADELSRQVGRPVELVSLNTYQSVLDEFEQKHIDGAFVGSMLAVLAHDRLGTVVLARPVHPNGVSTYCGVIIVREDSPITSVEQLAGRSLAMLRTTTAGNLFPIYLCVKDNMLSGDKRPKFRWVGTHDEVIAEVMAGNVDAGAVKNLRLDAYLAEHPEVKIRRLAESEQVPDNALIVRGDLPSAMRKKLTDALLAMDQSETGKAALAEFGAARFIRCTIADYGGVYRMIAAIGPAWNQLGVEGPPPHPPVTSGEHAEVPSP